MAGERNDMATQATDEYYASRENTRVFKDESNNVCVEIEGEGEWSKVTARLAFPYSDPERFVILTSEDEEIGIVKDPVELDDESRQIVQEMVERRYHVPTIRRIIDIDDAHNAVRWIVETDRGVRDFLVRDRHNFHRVTGGDKIVVDVDGCRFRIPRRGNFDPRTRKLLDLHG